MSVHGVRLYHPLGLVPDLLTTCYTKNFGTRAVAMFVDVGITQYWFYAIAYYTTVYASLASTVHVCLYGYRYLEHQ